MNSTEFGQLADYIENLWPGLEWVDERQAPVVFEKFETLPLAAVLEAVDLAFSDGRDYPPRPARLSKVASNIARRYREGRGLPEDTGPREGIEGFARRHGGLTPSQVAKQKAGVDPGVPAFPGFVKAER